MSSELENLYKDIYGSKPEEVTALVAHASKRQIFRLHGPARTVIGVAHEDVKENTTFIEFSRHFRSHGLPVPEIYGSDASLKYYLIQDLGDTTLHDVLVGARSPAQAFPGHVESLYAEALSVLPKFQITAGADLDYSWCRYSERYGLDSMLWDMDYFRKSFLDRINVQYSEPALSKDFETFAAYLLEAPADYFLYRDFQSRNIMLLDGTLYFIDYQGGRRGALQYDVASLLNQSSAVIPQDARERLFEGYLNGLSQYIEFDRDEFSAQYSAYCYIRLMQVLATYGEQGIGQGKRYFLDSIEPAVKNLHYLLEHKPFHTGCVELKNVYTQIIEAYL